MFVVDCLDCFFFLATIIILIVTIFLEVKDEEELRKTTIMDIFIMGVCTVGVMYEGSIARSFSEFLIAETVAAKILRTFKYLRVMIIIFSKSIWEEGHKLVVCIC